MRNLQSKTDTTNTATAETLPKDAWIKKVVATRKALSEISKPLQELVKAGIYESVNEALIKTIYRTAEHQEFNSFKAWKIKGFKVKKGEKGYPVWSRPVSVLKEEKGEGADDESTKQFRIAYIFSNAQVEPIKEEEQA